MTQDQTARSASAGAQAEAQSEPTAQAQAPAPVAPAAQETVTVTYTGEDSFLYGDRLVEQGSTLELPAAEVDAWGDSPPQHFSLQDGAAQNQNQNQNRTEG